MVKMKKIAKEIMTKDIIAVNVNTTVYEAASKMVDNRISGVPVLNSEQEIVGVVTEKDLLVVLDFLGVHQAKDTTVDECMSKELVVVDEETIVEEIARIFIQKNIKRVPVLQERRVVGIVSRHDILKDIL